MEWQPTNGPGRDGSGEADDETVALGRDGRRVCMSIGLTGCGGKHGRSKKTG